MPNKHSNIGIAIAVHNSSEQIRECLTCLGDYNFNIVLFDDGSSDGTSYIARECNPNITILNGDGSAWWSGGTAAAVRECFRLGCEFVLMLNPDTYIEGETVLKLVDYAQKNPMQIMAALVVDNSNPDLVAWGGSRRLRIPYTPIVTSKYIVKRGSKASSVGRTPYSSDEAHGRGVLISRMVYDVIGELDYFTFPHYGGDIDYSYRALSAKIPIVILPYARARLATENSGMALRSKPWTWSRAKEVFRYLTSRKHGEALRVIWHLQRLHSPRFTVIPNYLFAISLLIFRRIGQR